MPYRRLLVFVEGGADEQFFRSVLLAVLHRTYDDVGIVRFSEMRKPKLEDFVRSTSRMQVDYIFLHDLDRKACVSAAKEALHARFPWLDPARIQIVCAEIESWYCAGLGPEHPRLGSLHLVRIPDTRGVTKEILAQELGSERPPMALLTSMLQGFDLARAARRNASLRYFLRKHAGLDF